MVFFLKASKVQPSANLQRKINKIRDYLENEELLIAEDYHFNIENDNQLFEHQNQGVRYMLNIMESDKGFILADDSFLGN